MAVRNAALGRLPTVTLEAIVERPRVRALGLDALFRNRVLAAAEAPLTGLRARWKLALDASSEIPDEPAPCP